MACYARAAYGGLKAPLRFFWREAVISVMMAHGRENSMSKGVPHRRLRPDQSFVAEIPESQFDLIGRIAAAWSYLEISLDDLLWHFLDLDDEDGRVMTARFDADRKCQLVSTLGSRHLSKAQFQELDGVLKTIQSLKEDRNFVIHGLWGKVMPEGIPAAQSIRLKADPYRVVMETFEPIRMVSICDGIDVAREQIAALTKKLEPLRGRSTKPPLP